MVKLPDTGRTGDVNFCQVIANDVQADKQQAAFTQFWSNLVTNPAVPRGKLYAHGAGPGCQVTPVIFF